MAWSEISTTQTPNWSAISDTQVASTQAKRMAEMHLSSPWRGPMIHPESQDDLNKRASTVFMYAPSLWAAITESQTASWSEIDDSQ